MSIWLMRQFTTFHEPKKFPKPIEPHKDNAMGRGAMKQIKVFYSTWQLLGWRIHLLSKRSNPRERRLNHQTMHSLGEKEAYGVYIYL